MPESKKEYFLYTVKDVTISTIKTLLEGKGTFITGFKNSTEFINYDAGTGESNKDRILRRYSVNDQYIFSSKTNYDDFPIVYGTTILIPFSKIDRDIIPLVVDTNQMIDSIAFLADQLRDNYNNPKHVRVAQLNTKSLGSYKEMFSHISVWVWSKALSSKIVGTGENQKIEYDDTIIDITPYVSDITTTVNENGGSFNLVLDTLLSKFTNKWEIKDTTLKKLKSGEVINQSHLHDENQQRQNLFFLNALQENDIVWIRFETLQSEPDRLTNEQTFEVNKNDLQFKTYDMIGLIDKPSLDDNFSVNDIVINVSGRDLMKLFIEDGVYFYPFDFIKGGIFANEHDDARLIRYDGQLLSRFQQGFKKIDNIMNFIINALGTIKICSDTLFDPYINSGGLNTTGSKALSKTIDRRSKKLTSTGEQIPLKGIWQIIELIIDKSVQNRIVADGSIGNEHGSLINAIRKVCQDPLVEFSGDTFGDKYYITVRKPPFDQEGLLSLLDGIVIDEKGNKTSTNPIVIDIYDEDIEKRNIVYGGEAFSWYRITPQGSFQGGDEMTFAYLRAVYLKEYADIFGSKPMDIVSNYIPYQPFVSADAKLGNAYMIKQGIYDMQYLIQSHQYLPFIKRGVITLASGDRRIKRGTLVRLVSSGEIGIVEAVTNNAGFNMSSITRSTTISLDRILVEKYIRGVNVKGIENVVSYFNIVNTDIPANAFTMDDNYIDFSKQVCGKWKVNPDVFNFFLQKRQFVS